MTLPISNSSARRAAMPGRSVPTFLAHVPSNSITRYRSHIWFSRSNDVPHSGSRMPALSRFCSKGFRSSDTASSWARVWRAEQVNLPVVYIQLGTVKAPLWLDSGWGYGTSKHLIVFVNTVLFEQLRGAGIAMKRSGSVVNSDCQGNRSEDDLWQVDTTPLVFVTQDGQPLFEYAAPTLQVRGKSPCGTIGNRPEPIGTVGALFLPRWGTVVFDGLNERVWVPRANDAISPPRRIPQHRARAE